MDKDLEIMNKLDNSQEVEFVEGKDLENIEGAGIVLLVPIIEK